MKLIGLFLLMGWYTAAKAMQKRGVPVSGWRVRCLSCQESRPATEANILAVKGRVTRKYSLGQCERCDKVSGMAIEPVEEQMAA